MSFLLHEARSASRIRALLDPCDEGDCVLLLLSQLDYVELLWLGQRDLTTKNASSAWTGCARVGVASKVLAWWRFRLPVGGG